MKLSPLRQLSDMADGFEPTERLAATLEQNEMALAEKLLAATAALRQSAPPAMAEHVKNLEALIGEHRTACSDLLCVDIRLQGEKAFKAGLASD